MACNNCRCGSKKNPLAEKVSQNIEKYKILEILRKLQPVAEKIAHYSGKSLEEIFQEDLKSTLREALEFELRDTDEPEQKNLLDRFEEDFHQSLMIQLGKATPKKKIPSLSKITSHQ